MFLENNISQNLSTVENLEIEKDNDVFAAVESKYFLFWNYSDKWFLNFFTLRYIEENLKSLRQS